VLGLVVASQTLLLQPFAVTGFGVAVGGGVIASSSSSSSSYFGRRSSNSRSSKSFTIGAVASAGETIECSSASSLPVVSHDVPPSWDELSNALAKALADNKNEQEEPTALLTLFRDTNAWCPFCERVWVALRVKGIPYKEQLVSLQNKPEWYKAMVPTTLVPAVLFHGDLYNNNSDEKRNERKIVWESLDVMKALDKEFPNHGPQLLIMDDDNNDEYSPAFKQAMELADSMNSAGFAFIYSSRNETISDAEQETSKQNFVQELDNLDEALANAVGGPFRLGKDFTGLDAIIVPTLERWRYQLPITIGMDILENRPHLQAWFDAMDSFSPYSDRVAGDAYSWTATQAMFSRYFGGGEDKPEVAKAIELSETLSQQMTSSFADAVVVDVDGTFALEAASKLISNYEAVVNDCTNAEPKSQKDVQRGTDSKAADLVLRYVASILLSPNPSQEAAEAPLVVLDSDSSGTTATQDAALAARTVAARLCVPRDMGAPAAKLFRKVLATVANRLENSK